MTTLADIKAAIEDLSAQQRAALAAWLAELDQEAWDAQITEDFSPGGAGMGLLEEIDAQIDEGNFSPLR